VTERVDMISVVIERVDVIERADVLYLLVRSRVSVHLIFISVFVGSVDGMSEFVNLLV